jgi:hypothetical protein
MYQHTKERGSFLKLFTRWTFLGKEQTFYRDLLSSYLFEACRSLTDKQMDRQIQGISGSVRELLMHIVGGQQTFVLRTKGRQHEGELGR